MEKKKGSVRSAISVCLYGTFLQNSQTRLISWQLSNLAALQMQICDDKTAGVYILPRSDIWVWIEQPWSPAVLLELVHF